MFDILITLCLAGGEVCGERLLPAGLPDQAACEAAAPARMAAWATELGEGVASDARCIAQADMAAHVPPLEVTEVAPGVFVHTGQHAVPAPSNAGDLANLGFVVGAEAVAVIDAGTARGVAEGLYAAVRARTTLPIRWLVLTHMHPDHSLGAALFQEAGAKVLGHPNLAFALANRAESYTEALRRLLGERAYLGTRLIAPDETAERREIDLGGRSLLVRAYPLAHTETDLTVLDRESGTLFVGDLVFVGHTPALDGSILGWQKLLSRLADEPVERIVPGHGPAMIPWPAGLDATRDYLAAVTAEARDAIATGEPLSSASRHIGESQRANWELFDEFNQRNATAAYKELEWE